MIALATDFVRMASAFATLVTRERTASHQAAQRSATVMGDALTTFVFAIKGSQDLIAR